MRMGSFGETMETCDNTPKRRSCPSERRELMHNLQKTGSKTLDKSFATIAVSYQAS